MEEMEKSFFSREGENWIEYRIEYTGEIAEEKKRIFLPPPPPPLLAIYSSSRGGTERFISFAV